VDITLTLKPEVERGLLARARERGLTLDAYLDDLVKREAGIAAGGQMSGKERAEAFVAWAKGHRATPPLSDEAISRSSIYPDRS
jgi:hypothetical protein